MSYNRFEKRPCRLCGVVCRFKISYQDDGKPWNEDPYLVCQPCQHKAQAEWYEHAAKKHWRQFKELLAKRAARATKEAEEK